MTPNSCNKTLVLGEWADKLGMSFSVVKNKIMACNLAQDLTK